MHALHILSGLYRAMISCWADKGAGQHPSCKTQPEKFGFPPRNHQTPQCNCNSFGEVLLTHDVCQLSNVEFVAIASTPIAGKRKLISVCGDLTLAWDAAVAFVPRAHLLFPSVGAGIFSRELVFWWPYMVVWQCPLRKVESWAFRGDWDPDCFLPETWVTLRP